MTSKGTAKNGSRNKASQQQAPIWEWERGPQLDAWMLQTMQEAATKLLLHTAKDDTKTSKNNNNNMAQQQLLKGVLYPQLIQAVEAVRLVPVPPPAVDDDDNNNNNEPVRKRRKKVQLEDPFHVWWITKYNQKPNDDDGDGDDDDYEDLPATLGGRLSQLSPGALLNGLVGKRVVHKAHPNEVAVVASAVQQALAVPPQYAAAAAATTTTTATYASFMWQLAQDVHRSLQAAVANDIWRTTPARIQERLAPEVTRSEFAAIRKRVYETVILGKGLHNLGNDDDDGEDDDDRVAAAAPVPVHDAEKFKKCPNCGNADQSNFALDRKNGDIICSNCGVVVSESLMHEGSAYRKFEGEADRNHHGDRANPLLSTAHNLSTTLSGVAPGSGIDGYRGGGGGGGNLETILRNTHAYTELNLSQYGKTDRRTREGYKDRQKKEAFVQLTHTGDALHLHEAVVQRAKELFAGFRDDRELVQQFKGVLAACLCEAFEQLAREEAAGTGRGSHLVKGVGGSDLQRQAAMTSDDNEDGKPQSKRAARRNELHHATLAGQGGLLLDFSNVRSTTAARAGGEDDANAAAANDDSGKPAAKWDLEDCRSWLLGASRRIAQQWVNERQRAANKEEASKLPSGPLEELEGKLVEHSILLCEHLEQELLSRNQQQASNHKKSRVITPRVKDMSKLGIQWQHAHERGSGGKGGVGGSGTTRVAVQQQNGRTAGQLLLLKTAKKLGSILNDPLAGGAIHRELRAVIGKQETQKRKKILEEASRQRFQQMKRKPWLQARAKIQT